MLTLQQLVNLLLILSNILLFYNDNYAYAQISDNSNSKPHIIFIVADDMGWNDVSFHGANEIPTPNIDALAFNGVILNRHYVLPVCTPSRASLMTGRYPIREGTQGRPWNPGEPRNLPLNVTLMPEYMRRLGYKTHLLGKWHLGYETDNHTPTRRGFDNFFGYYNGLITYFNKTINGEFENGTYVNGYDLHRDGPEGLHVEFNDIDYFTDLITDEAEKIIRNNKNEKPLFLVMTHLATHAGDSMIETLEVRNTTENEEMFSYIKDDRSRKYAGMMKAMDDSVGRVIKALADENMLNNSLVVFLSDNGAPTIGLYETPGSNYPMRGVKNTLFEGAIRGAACIFSPLIKKTSRISKELMHMSDWLPTLYSAAGGKLADLGEIDGVNQWDYLVNDNDSPRDDLLVNIDEVKDFSAAIIDRYKLVQGAVSSGNGYYGRIGDDPSYPLYNMHDTLNSLSGKAINQLSNFDNVSLTKARILRESSMIRCERPTSFANCSTFCLFNVFQDPCETQDLSRLLPEKVQALRSYIDEYRKVLVPQPTGLLDLCSLPKYFNNTWTPWRKDDANMSTIIPESFCMDG